MWQSQLDLADVYIIVPYASMLLPLLRLLPPIDFPPKSITAPILFQSIYLLRYLPPIAFSQISIAAPGAVTRMYTVHLFICLFN